MDNRRLSPSQLGVLRQKVVEAVIEKGYKQNEVSRLLGISTNSVSKYIRSYRQEGEVSLTYKKRGMPKNHRVLMSESIEAEMKGKIEKMTPDQLGLKCVLWTREAVKEYLQQFYGISYSKWTVGRLLRKWGYSPQKPIKRAFEQDPIKMKQWLEEEYPKIKQRAIKEKAAILWGDEMGLQSDDHRGRTYGKIGQTPVIGKTGSRFRCNMIAAISNQGFMKWMVIPENFTSKEFIEFLRRLIYRAQGKIFLIVDNLRVHHSKQVSQWLSTRKDNIELFFLPPYAPQLNPQELVNQDVKSHAGNFRVMKTKNDLLTNLRVYLTKIQLNPSKITNFFQKKEVLYAA